MTRLITISTALILAGCTDRSPNPEEEESSGNAPTITDTFVINYNHGDAEAAVAATASNLDGVYKLSVTRNGSEKTKEIDNPTFQNLWDGIIDIPDIAENSVSDPDAPMDFRTHHIIGIVYSTGGQQGIRTFAVPADRTSKGFQNWVKFRTNFGFDALVTQFARARICLRRSQRYDVMQINRWQ